MFYFGGMTLGYLTPPGRETGAEDGGKMAGTAQALPTGPAKDANLEKRSLIARANWFSFYW